MQDGEQDLMKLINKNRIEYFFLKFLFVIISLLGIRFINIPVKGLTILIYYIIPIGKKIVIKNLRAAFLHKPYKEIKQICFNNYYSFVYTLLEILLIQNMSKAEILSKIEFKNVDEIGERIITL